jgi:hypothetical protein
VCPEEHEVRPKGRKSTRNQPLNITNDEKQKENRVAGQFFSSLLGRHPETHKRNTELPCGDGDRAHIGNDIVLYHSLFGLASCRRFKVTCPNCRLYGQLRARLPLSVSALAKITGHL